MDHYREYPSGLQHICRWWNPALGEEFNSHRNTSVYHIAELKQTSTQTFVGQEHVWPRMSEWEATNMAESLNIM